MPRQVSTAAHALLPAIPAASRVAKKSARQKTAPAPAPLRESATFARATTTSTYTLAYRLQRNKPWPSGLKPGFFPQFLRDNPASPRACQLVTILLFAALWPPLRSPSEHGRRERWQSDFGRSPNRS